jgi:alpha-N-arabinofuranosidase
VIPGFYPDPSVCRVGEDYYLVNSSFEYFPGIPIWKSRDLVNWQQLGHVLTRDSQLPLASVGSSKGVFAPTIRYHDGTFYVVSSIVEGGDMFYVTATDPAGPWSEPVWLNESEWGMDPSLFFDDDGKVYYTRHGGQEQGGIYQAELDLQNGRLVETAREIWGGTGGVWPEGPHLYKIDGTYYLLVAEGGTSYDHKITIARSSSPWGPFESFSENPILTHSDRRSEPIQATGHGDLVQTPEGNWWMVLLGIRPPDGSHHHLGRETFLAPVAWNDAGWPVVNQGEPIALTMPGAGLPNAAPVPPESLRDDFDGTELGLPWNYLRNPTVPNYSLATRAGFLRLTGTSTTMNDQASPTFVARRQRHLSCRVSTMLEFEPPAEGHEAGLVLRQNEANHYDLVVTYIGGAPHARLRSRVAGTDTIVQEADLADGPVTLIVEASPLSYQFFVASGGAEPVSLGTLDTAPLSSESAGGFTGVYFGLYATTPSGTAAPADFDSFEIEPR